jgi:hypothetical protein
MVFKAISRRLSEILDICGHLPFRVHFGRISRGGDHQRTNAAPPNGEFSFPLTTQYPFGFSVERPVIVHRFGSLDAKQEQRYYVGIGPRKFQFKHPNLNWAEGKQLRDFWESMQGPWQAFTHTVPNPDGTTTGVLVTFEQTPISFEYLRNAVQVGLNLIEVVDPTAAPTYTISSTCVRFPSTALSTALLSEVQQIVPLIRIRVRHPGLQRTGRYFLNAVQSRRPHYVGNRTAQRQHAVRELQHHCVRAHHWDNHA